MTEMKTVMMMSNDSDEMTEAEALAARQAADEAARREWRYMTEVTPLLAWEAAKGRFVTRLRKLHPRLLFWVADPDPDGLPTDNRVLNIGVRVTIEGRTWGGYRTVSVLEVGLIESLDALVDNFAHDAIRGIAFAALYGPEVKKGE